jgi:hypothetical protein
MDSQSIDQPEPEPTSSDSSRRGLPAWLLWGLFLLCYVVSIVPAAKLQEARVIPPKLFDTIYAPILFLCDEFDLWHYETN